MPETITSMNMHMNMSRNGAVAASSAKLSYGLPMNKQFKTGGNSSGNGNESLLGLTSSSLFHIASSYPPLPQQRSHVAATQPSVFTTNQTIDDVLFEVEKDFPFVSDPTESMDSLSAADFEPRPLDVSRMHIVDSFPLARNPVNFNSQARTVSLLQEVLTEVLDENEPLPFVPEQSMSHTFAEPTSSMDNKRGNYDDVDVALPVKRRRVCDNQEEDYDELDGRRFRPYQAEQWSEKFAELMEFKNEKGHCCVPHTFKEKPALARWVKRQRYQYKLKQEGKQSTMTDERVVALEDAGFIWDSHGAAWQERLNELADYRVAIGHCNVPSCNPSNPQLATWVKCQRRQFKLYLEGVPNNMTAERINQLESLGFEWELRRSSKSAARARV